MKVLITGINGFVGKQLSLFLKSKNFDVVGLTHSNPSQGVYLWDIHNDYVDENALMSVDIVINLAGETIAQRWTSKTKKRIYDSRVNGTKLLFNKLRENNIQLKLYIGMSAVGIYGNLSTKNHPLTEDAPFGNDFLAKVCSDWEAQHNLFKQISNRTVLLRSGTIIHKDGGVLKKMLPFAKLGVLSELGNGEQILSWISLNDIVRMIDFIITQTECEGVYNAVSGNISNKDFTRILLAHFNKKPIFPKVPALLIKLFFGEMSSVLLKGLVISNQKSKQIMFNYVDKYLNKCL